MENIKGLTAICEPEMITKIPRKMEFSKEVAASMDKNDSYLPLIYDLERVIRPEDRDKLSIITENFMKEYLGIALNVIKPRDVKTIQQEGYDEHTAEVMSSVNLPLEMLKYKYFKELQELYPLVKAA